MSEIKQERTRDSATDIFAAGFKDHRIGHILGVDGNTGAGGANVWTHNLLRQLLRLPAPVDAASPYETLPGGAGMRVAIRRTLRVGEQSGTPLEDLGVEPDSLEKLTKDDLLEGNRDLINKAALILTSMPVRRLSASATATATGWSVQTTTGGISRLDIYADERPLKSVDVSDGDQTIDIDAPAGTARFRLQGFMDNKLVAARLLDT